MTVFDIVLNMITKKAIIQNENGIHVRPSQVISTRMMGYTGAVTITTHQLSISDMNIISIISLGLIKGDAITITVEGPDEEQTGNRLVELFETEYDFPPRA
jgi:phosphocarrier protein HPr